MQEKNNFPAQEQAGRDHSRLSCLLFYSGPHWVDKVHPHWGGQSALVGLPIQILIWSRNTFTDTPRIKLNQLSEHSMAQSGLHMKFTITVSQWKSFALLLCLLIRTSFMLANKNLSVIVLRIHEEENWVVSFCFWLGGVNKLGKDTHFIPFLTHSFNQCLKLKMEGLPLWDVGSNWLSEFFMK